jgi:hypothetical protein
MSQADNLAALATNVNSSGVLQPAGGGTGTTTSTGTGSAVLSNSPTLVTPDLGTPASGVMTNVSGTAANLTAGVATVARSVSNSGGWSVTPSGTKLFFNYNGTNVASLDSSGNLICLANVTAYGTP